MHNFTPNTVPEEMVPTATPSEVTAQEVRDFLNNDCIFLSQFQEKFEGEFLVFQC